MLFFFPIEALSVTVTEVRLVSARPYVMDGQPAILTCHYILDPNEVVTEVEWEKDDVLVYLWTLDEPPEARDVLEGLVDLNAKSPSILNISAVNMHMHGTYTCRVRTNGKMASNEIFLMIIVDACKQSSWKTYTDMVSCQETVNMHCIGIFPKPSPACGVYEDRLVLKKKKKLQKNDRYGLVSGDDLADKWQPDLPHTQRRVAVTTL
ncbi:uncharacterized protein NPIL_59711 [Nephila pilipes]|uniref:Ig-like domain-containing protein n=1 Tax=Nephila pilipes TaxID=299642 RepID=A0A8X6P4J0_NEPPI|nr:uncharacterized protein NPIL_59711 [Nephila pilipes]